VSLSPATSLLLLNRFIPCHILHSITLPDLKTQHLDELVAHTRNAQLFDVFSSRIALHHAHLAHAQNQNQRALDCYRVSATLAHEQGDRYIRIAARAGEVALRIGMFREANTVDEREWEDIVHMGKDVADASIGLGGTLESVGRIISAGLTTEILKAKYVLLPFSFSL
jgi:hypothetical protein